ncbi:MAG: nucleoside-diphosphate kinase [Candidatus Omnitrophica bacterium CG1_02_46_14]|nr:MAG: nucleoside-diphosphate kinase [Candidatus Omnitrophica bacterium CG1_02_46_14]
MSEPTLVIIKPDGLQKSLTGNILTRLSETRLSIVGCKIKTVSRELAEEHYRHLKDKPFFEEIVRYLMGEFHTKRVMAMVYYGDNAIQKVRKICGATNPEEAEPGTIRGSFGRITTKGIYENAIHASSDSKDAEREVKLWFDPDEIMFDNLFPTKEAIVPQKKKMVWA